MSREKSEGVIYKLVRYSDSSAIGFAFTKDYGKCKLFIPKAYSKKGGVICFMPGLIDFAKKNSDLNRYYGFESNIAYYHYIDNHEIILRLHLLFEILDGLYEIDMADEQLFVLLMKIDDDNFRKITAYIIYFMLRKSGVMYDLKSCSACGSDENLFTVSKDGIYCERCAEMSTLRSYCDRETAYILKSMGNSSLYRNVTVNRKQEIQLLEALVAYVEQIIERKLKSFKTLIDCL